MIYVCDTYLFQDGYSETVALHAIAKKIGLRREDYVGDYRLPHYRVAGLQREAVDAGAVAATSEFLVEVCRQRRVTADALAAAAAAEPEKLCAWGPSSLAAHVEDSEYAPWQEVPSKERQSKQIIRRWNEGKSVQQICALTHRSRALVERVLDAALTAGQTTRRRA